MVVHPGPTPSACRFSAVSAVAITTTTSSQQPAWLEQVPRMETFPEHPERGPLGGTDRAGQGRGTAAPAKAGGRFRKGPAL